jgi:hypothetical protein
VDGETVSVKATAPVKPVARATVIVEVPVEPTRTLTELGVAASWKAVTMKVTLVERLAPSPKPVTVTL